MDVSSKEALIEAPPDYSPVARIPCLSPHLKRLLIIVVVVVIIVLVVLGFLLMGLRISEKHTETVLRMTIQGLDGEGFPQQLSVSGKERTETFHIKAGINSSATVVYDYPHLLICYKSWQGRACYITKMDKENIQGLDTIAKAFQHLQVCAGSCGFRDSGRRGDSSRPTVGMPANDQLLDEEQLSPGKTKVMRIGKGKRFGELVEAVSPPSIEGPLFKSLSALCTEGTSKWHRRSSKMEISIKEALIGDPLVLQMTIEGLEGEESGLRLSMDWEEEVVTFLIDAGTHDPGTVVYDYSNLLISYKSWQGRACYITKMDKENIQGLDTIAKAFHQHLQLKSLILTPEQGEEEEQKGFPVTLADRSILGTTVNILCSNVPIYWA
ncbi:Pulmonary surfactant-associated protein C [Chelonia mydas]|uniref:Surfactant protein C n=1 Tax=Chelonia mydas TaxID=8469 RepID=M7AW07_CHEMY|nr:Pulmonary surfactant-associated protein C [Chelonia mydas]